MIVSRNVVILSGAIIIVLFAIINRVRFYAESEVVYVNLHKIPSEDIEHLYRLSYEYQGKICGFEHGFTFEQDTNKQKKLLINTNPNPFEDQTVFIFNFTEFFLGVIIIGVSVFVLWIAFLESFFPKRDKFHLFKRKEIDE